MNLSNLKLMGWRWWLASFLPHSVRGFWNTRVRTIYAPQHNELRALIPRTWSDLDVIMEVFLYGCVITFVEGENGLKTWDCQGPEHPAKQRAPMLYTVYEWAKTGRAAFEDKILMAYPIRSEKSGLEGLIEDLDKGAEDYALLCRLEKEFDDLDTKYLKWIIENRKLFWT